MIFNRDGSPCSASIAYEGRSAEYYWLFFHTNRPPTNRISITMMNMMRVSITTPFVRTRHATKRTAYSPRKETDGHLPLN
jgi:hypothetical protein